MDTYTHISRIVLGAGVWACCLGIGQTDALAGFLESPSPNATLSGIGFISGWKCDAQDITVRIDGGPSMDMAMDIPREDTRSTCNGEANNGFIIQTNWNNLSAGTHTAVAYDNGIEFDRNTFTVGTPGKEFLVGVTVDIDVPDFPAPGETSRFVWNQSTQHLELAEVYSEANPPTTPTSSTLAEFQFLLEAGDGAGNMWEMHLEDIRTEESLGSGYVAFSGFHTAATGADILIGGIRGSGISHDSSYVNFEMGHTVDVLPRLPSLHRYRYAWGFPITINIAAWQDRLGSHASSFCYVMLFDTLIRDRYGEVDMSVIVTITARENGVCVPENGEEHLIPLSAARLYVSTD